MFSDGLRFVLLEVDAAVVAAVDLCHVHVVLPVGVKQFCVRRDGALPEFGQAALECQAGDVVIGAAEGNDGHVVHQGGNAAGAVEGNHAGAVAQKDGQGDVVDVVDAAFEFRMFFDEVFDDFAVVDEAAVHRVVFDQQRGVLGRMEGEGREDVQQEVADGGEVAVHTDLAVVENLQGDDEETAEFARFHPFGKTAVFQPIVGALDAGQAPKFDVVPKVERAVVGVVRVAVAV